MKTLPVLVVVVLAFQAWMILLLCFQGNPSGQIGTTSQSSAAINATASVNGKYPIANILLLGQFNYDTPLERIISWIKIWSKYFAKISVVGPFSQETYEIGRELGLDIHVGAADEGHVSPIENLVHALIRAPTDVDAVLYVHDDGLLNLTNLFQGKDHLPTDRFLGNLPAGISTYSVSIPREDDTSTMPITYQHLEEDDTTPMHDMEQFMESFGIWAWRRPCFVPMRQMLLESREIQDFAASATGNETRYILTGGKTDGMFSGVADFLLVPLSYRDSFVRIARIFVQYRIFLECSLPNIIFWTLQHELRLQHALNASHFSSAIFQDLATPVGLCTHFSDDPPYPRGTVAFLQMCSMRTPNVNAMYHPFKMSVRTAKNYSQWLDRIQGPWNDSYFLE